MANTFSLTINDIDSADSVGMISGLAEIIDKSNTEGVIGPYALDNFVLTLEVSVRDLMGANMTEEDASLWFSVADHCDDIAANIRDQMKKLALKNG